MASNLWTALSICRLREVIEFNRNRSRLSGLQTLTEAGAVVQRCRGPSGAVVQRCRGTSVAVVQRCIGASSAEVQRCRSELGEWDI